MRTSPFIIVFTGAPGSGKSGIIERFTKISSKVCNDTSFTPVPFKKYTTREYRSSEASRKKNGKFVDIVPVSEIPQKCDLVYESYGNKYGLNTRELQKKMDEGTCPIVVINDVRAIENLKQKFVGKVLSLFIFQYVPVFEEFKNCSDKRGSMSENEFAERYKKATTFYYSTYIKNITVFDGFISNKRNKDKDKYKYTISQIEKILNDIFSDEICLNNYNPIKAVTFFLFDETDLYEFFKGLIKINEKKKHCITNDDYIPVLNKILQVDKKKKEADVFKFKKPGQKIKNKIKGKIN